mmetsp:Transcript_18975/g.34252  ORF Transcript_18975/g.34252 Transcript_18975/m.34252 type:complete len:227 (+) Transcript_18975:37-717(+)
MADKRAADTEAGGESKKVKGSGETFVDFDVSQVFEEGEEGEGGELTDDTVKTVETGLGYTLPKAWIDLVRKTKQNGGNVVKKCCATSSATTWAANHVQIEDIMAIGQNLIDEQEDWIGEWEYPKIGVYFGNCPSAGHDMIALDYRECGPTGEPSVVHVDQESDYKITKLAENFEEFIRKLQPEEDFEEEGGEGGDEEGDEGGDDEGAEGGDEGGDEDGEGGEGEEE